jgi:seryl-tRNA synthetase
VLDLKLIRDNPEILMNALMARGQSEDAADTLLESIQEKDNQRRQQITALQEAQTKRNHISKQVGKAKAEKREADAEALMAEMAGLKDMIAEAEGEEKALTAELEDVLAGIPNIPFEDVPVGDESANTEIRRWGEPPTFNFAPKQHFELGEALGLMDFEVAAKLSGSRFVVLKGALARLERALGAFMLDLQTGEGGYTEVAPPLLVRDQAMFGTAQLPKFLEDQFSVYAGPAGGELLRLAQVSYAERLQEARQVNDEEDIERLVSAYPDEYLAPAFWLIPTAEVVLTNLVREDILDEAALPIRVTAQTPCFRAEAGAAGKDTRGMVRLHQFTKVELVSITTAEQSEAEHERMTACAEEVLKRLGLPFRTVVLATGDIGFAARKTYDVEVWLPGQSTYREISSCSNCGDFQARRMSARYRPKGAKDVRFVHTLNGSGLAVGRTLIAVLENYQEEDGSIRIPDALVPYMGGMTGIVARR